MFPSGNTGAPKLADRCAILIASSARTLSNRGAAMSKRKVTRTAELKGRQLLERLRPRFPALFPVDHKDLKPWAVSEGQRLRQTVAGETVSSQVWHAAIDLWFYGDRRRRIAYLQCLIAGAPRYDRHGNAAGQVSDKEAAQAAAELAERKGRPPRLRAAGRLQGGAGKARGFQQLPIRSVMVVCC